MQILLLLKQSPADQQALSLILQGVQTQCPNFSWDIVHTSEEYLKVAPCFRVMVGDASLSANAQSETLSASNLVWPIPGKILKDPALKEKIWDQIQTELIPAFLAKPGTPEISLDLSSEQIKRILLRITESTMPFTFKLQNSLRVGVNLPEKDIASVDVSLDAADLASMLTAAWVFGASRIELPKGYDATRDKPY